MCDVGMRRRMVAAEELVNAHRLNKTVFKRHNVSLDVNMKLLNACVLSVATYGNESQTVTEEIEKKLNACDSQWLKRIL